MAATTFEAVVIPGLLQTKDYARAVQLMGLGHLVSDEGDVAAMVKMFDDVRELALNEADSASMLAAILKEHRRKGRRHA